MQNNDTVFIEPGLTHPHCTAPGYALWYLWVIRHLDGQPYKNPEYPVFLKDHLWVTDKDAVYWGSDLQSSRARNRQKAAADAAALI